MKQAEVPQNNSTSASITDMNSLKAQFLSDMELAGLASASRRTYLDAVEQLIRYTWCSPADLTTIGKRNRQRLVPIPPMILHALREMWKSHRNQRYLFPNRYGKTHVSDSTG